MLFHRSVFLFLFHHQDVSITMALQYSLMSGSVILTALFFILKIAEATLGLLGLYINFWNICSRSVKYVIGHFKRNFTEYIDCFG